MTNDIRTNNLTAPVKPLNAADATANVNETATAPGQNGTAEPKLNQDANQVNVPGGDVQAVDLDGIELDTEHHSTEHTSSPVSSETTSPVESPDHTGPNPKSWSHGSNVVEGRKFSSVGDPHETTGDGGKFDNMEEGNFVKARSASGDFELQTVQGRDVSGRWPNATVNHAAAVKSGNDVVAYNGIDKTLTINGEAKELKPGQSYDLPGGGKVNVTDKGVTITTQAGDVVDITQRDNYIDVRGEVGPDRKDGEIRGSLGVFDADTDASNDLVSRDGTVMGNMKDQAVLDKFIEEWRTKPEENLFGNDPIGNKGAGEGDSAEVKADKELWAKMDINQDNLLDGNEVGEFGNFDVNGDGNVDLMEFLKGRHEARAAQAPAPGGAVPAGTGQTDADFEAEFKARDITGNGALTGTEIPADFKKAFPDVTRVTLQEFLAFRRKQEADAAKKDTAEFKKADVNQDGRLDGNELGNWAQFDANQDGEVSEEEALKALAEQRAAARAAELAAFLKQVEERRAAAQEAVPPPPPADAPVAEGEQQEPAADEQLNPVAGEQPQDPAAADAPQEPALAGAQ